MTLLCATNTWLTIIFNSLSVITAALITAFMSYRINQINERKELKKQLDEILNIAIEYPYLESESFTQTWLENKDSQKDKYLRYDTYCIRVFNFHLESIGFHKSDDMFYQDLITMPAETPDIKKGVWRLISKMNAAYAKRAEQARILAQLIADSPYRTLACGDMNDTPASYTYRQISKTMNDGFCERAFGLGTSYNGAYPSFRIDYIFFSDGLYCENFTTIRTNYSDHFPIYSDLKINKL